MTRVTTLGVSHEEVFKKKDKVDVGPGRHDSCLGRLNKKAVSTMELMTLISYFKFVESTQRGFPFANVPQFVFRLSRHVIGLVRRKFMRRGEVPRSTHINLPGEGKPRPKSIRFDFTETRREDMKIDQECSHSKLPVFFLHYGNSDYLRYTLAQAKTSNPESTIYLLGDLSNNCYDFVEHHAFSDYFEEADEFSRIYRHFSTNSHSYTLFDFQRWFVLREFLAAHNLNKCLYLDSDTLLYADVTLERKKFEQFDFTLSQACCGCTFFLNRSEALDDFCQFLKDIYMRKNQYYYDKMVYNFALRQKNGLKGGGSDMWAFEAYRQAHFGEIGEAGLVVDGSVYDPNISQPHPGFEMSNGIKRISWHNDKPYGRHLRSGKEIRFNSLHFQGNKAKALISQFYRGTQFKSYRVDTPGKADLVNSG